VGLPPRSQGHALARAKARHVHHSMVVDDRDLGAVRELHTVEAVGDAHRVGIATGVGEDPRSDSVRYDAGQQAHRCHPRTGPLCWPVDTEGA
jgi:hypothetical protein